MVRPLYTAQLAQAEIVMDGTAGSLYVGPAGFVTVVRDIQVDVPALVAGDSLRVFIQDGHLVPVSLISTPKGPWGRLLLSFQGRATILEGQQLRWVTSGSGFSNVAFVQASGYQLTV